MSGLPDEEQSVLVERELSHPPEKVWRAITQRHLIEEWLMENDFSPVVGHRFELRFDWGTVECRVLEARPCRTLSYTWVSGELESVIRWTLTPTSRGTWLRMEQTGFPPGRSRYYAGAKAGWPRFVAALEQVLEKMDQGGE